MKVLIVFCSFWLGIMSAVWGQVYGNLEKDAPIWEIGQGKNKLMVYGYRGGKLENEAVRGEIQKDSSIFLSGFCVTTDGKSIFEASEASLYQLKRGGNFLYVDQIMNLPVGKDMSWLYVPVIRYAISKTGEHWTVGKPQCVLDMKNLTPEDFWKMKKDLGWDKLKPEIMFERDLTYPERRLMHAFLICLKYYPQYNDEYGKLEKGDGAIHEIYNEYEKILKELK